MLDVNDTAMDAKTLIDAARAAGVQLWTEGGKLRFRAPPHALTPELHQALRAHRERITHALRDEAAASSVLTPIAANQKGLWFLQRLAPESIAYNVAFATRIHGAVVTDALAEALQVVVDRHESLRSTYPALQGVPGRRVFGFQPVAFAARDMTERTDAELHEAVERDYAAPFDLDEGPLFRASLYQQSAERHVLLLVAHHIVLDGTSLFVLLSELLAVYAALAEDRTVPPRRDAAEFSEFVQWQESTLAEAAEARRYWARVLDPPPPPLDLPTDRPRPQLPRFCGRTLRRILPADVTASLRDLAKAEGTTEFVVLLALWFAFLQRITGQSDLTVGTPVHGRAAARFSHTLGNLINMIPLRIRDVRMESFRHLVHEVRNVVLEGMTHQDFPLPQMVEQGARWEDRLGTPFQTLFSCQNFSQFSHLEQFVGASVEEHRQFGTLTLSSYPLDQQEGQFDLTLDVWHRGDDRICVWKYDVDLLAAETVEGWADAFSAMAEAVAQDPTPAVKAFPLTRATLAQSAIAGESLEIHGPTALDLVRTTVANHPTRIAVEDREQALTYEALDVAARTLASGLIEQGVRPGDRIGISTDRDAAMVVALLATWYAGATYVPLDPAFPEARLRHMIDHAGIRVIIADQRGRRACEGWLDPAVRLVDPMRHGHAPLRTPVPMDDDALSYVLYTSGSTGTPKGVAVPHRALTNFLVSMASRPGLTASDRLVAVTTFSFDISALELILPLTVGARVVVASAEVLGDGQRLAELIARAGATVMQATPATWRILLDADWKPVETFTALCGGEALTRQLADQLLAIGVTLWNMYGPTETTIWSTVARVEPDGQAPHLGEPIHNTQLYIVDEQGKPVPTGVVGELWIGGAGVATGYLNDASRTEERFLPGPHGAGSIYRTGDLVRRGSDGRLTYLGRDDQQLKVRGFRIEAGEIETVLLTHPAVRNAAIGAAADGRGTTDLVAWLELHPGMVLEQSELRAYLSERLPIYMVPNAWAILDRLPLTPNGKVDRKALPAPDRRANATRNFQAPEGAVETTLARIWTELLGVERVGRRDNFFHLGGHSLLAIKLVERMRREGLHVDIRSLFTAATLEELASAVSRETQDVEVPPNRIPLGCTKIRPEMLPLVELTQTQIDHIVTCVPGGAGNVQDIYPLAPLQEGILFHHLLRVEGDPYLLSGVLSFTIREQLNAFLHAVQAVVERHDIFRTSVIWEGVPEPLQVVWRTAPIHVEVIAIEPNGADALRQLQERFDPLRWRMDLSQAPLLRFYLAHDVVENRWLCLLLLHHVAGDHTTLELLQEEVRSFLRGDALHLPKPLPFRNLVAQARGAVSRNEHETFFRALLGDVDEPTAPFGLLEVHGDGFELAEAHQEVEYSLALRLREQARRQGVSTATLCHVAWAQVLACASRQENIVFGTVVFGRMQGGSGADRVMGPFINTLPIRIPVNERRVAASVRETQTLLAELMTHEHASLALAQQCSGVAAPVPLFSALLNYRHTTPSASPQPDDLWTLVPGIYPAERTNYPLVLSVDDLGTGLTLTAQVSAAIEPARICSLMHTALERLVDALEEDLDQALNGIDVLPVEDETTLADWNATDAEYPRDALLHELISARAAEMPDLIAVLSPEAGITPQLTYGELERRSDALAARLQSLGVRRDVPVAVLMERSAELVVALLAVLKAGGAYVPIDPNYPRERQIFMLEDAAPPVVLCQSRLASETPECYRTLAVDALWEELDAGGHWSPEATPDSLAYIIYTSGSTGRPKGAMIEHRSICNRLFWMQDYFGLSAADVVLQKTPYSFDVSVWEFFWPLLCGARLVMARPEGHKDPGYLLQTIQRYGVTTIHFVPSMLQLFLQQDVARCTSLRRIICSGEALSPALRSRVLELGIGELYNLYGPTEAAVDVSAWRCSIKDPSWTVPIGHPVANTQLHILDAQQRRVPIGVAGELYIGGAQVGRGYLNRPELTRERFLPDPFRSEPGARIYRTGDLARWRADGAIEYLGRTDFQVKIRGFRIELGEIEARLLEHPEVREALVLAREDRPAELRLVAYVIGSEALEVEPLRTHLLAQLPEYMVPAAYVRLDAFPLTPNGKIDRKALPVPESDAFLSQSYESPQGEAETILAQIWTELLGVERVGRRDNFFHLGGHSLLVIRLISALWERFGVRLSARTFFESSDLADLAQRIGAHSAVQTNDVHLGSDIEVLEF